ncbi:unnamed protein product [Merluccius merluccius]
MASLHCITDSPPHAGEEEAGEAEEEEEAARISTGRIIRPPSVKQLRPQSRRSARDPSGGEPEETRLGGGGGGVRLSLSALANNSNKLK